MLENEFFPTPKLVIEQMLHYGEYSGRRDKGTVLDPSAGAGAILDAVRDSGSRGKLFAIELNQDLRYTLYGKKYKVIGTDFLEYDEPTTFNWIFMNPPFSRGDAHILKAWEYLEHGGTLCALVNSQTLRSRHTKSREMLWDLIQEYGSVQDMGSCFADAERPTDVEVSMIKLKKPAKESINYFQDFKLDLDEEVKQSAYNPNTLASRDVVKDLVARYNAAKAILIDRYEQQSKLEFYIQGLSHVSVRRDEINPLDCPGNLNEQIEFLKAKFWATVFDKTEIGKKATSSFRKKFDEFSENQSVIAFTEESVKEVLWLFILNLREMMNESIIEVFDTATKYHEKNKIHHEGWKTNKSWKLSKRIIIPSGVFYDSSCGGWFDVSRYNIDFYNDLDRVMSYLSGETIDLNNSTYNSLHRFCWQDARKGKHYSTPIDSHFFTIKMFKKGTVHIDFKEQYLPVLNQINRIVAEGKNWLGQGC